MQRKPGFPITNCAIKMPENGNPPPAELTHCEDELDQQQRRQQLINFGHSQWGFNNWSWTVTKQELDFVDFSNGRYCAGVVAFVSITVKTVDIHRENIGYATSLATNKGLAIYTSRKCAVTNALKETLLSFGGNVAIDLMETLETARVDVAPDPVPVLEPVLPKPEPKASPPMRLPPRKEPEINVRAAHGAPLVANPPPVAKAHPMPAALPPPRAPLPRPPPPAPHMPPAPPPQLRPNSNVSFVLQPVMPPLYAPPRLGPPVAAPHVFPNAYYECSGPWHFYESYDRHPHGNVNLNFNIPPKSLVVDSRNGSVECKSACRTEGELQYGAQQGQGCWIKPTIFYDGFWTEQKVKKWVAEQVEKQFPEDASHESVSPSAPDASKS